MTPDEFKAWRLGHKLSHQAAADLLGASSRFVVLRWEAGSEMPSSMAARIAEAEEIIAKTPPGEAFAAAAAAKRGVIRDFSKHKCWTIQGQETTMADLETLPVGGFFIRLANSSKAACDPETGHLLANIFERTRTEDQPVCISVDMVTWEALAVAHTTEPNVQKGVEAFNRLLAGKRAGLSANDFNTAQ